MGGEEKEVDTQQAERSALQAGAARASIPPPWPARLTFAPDCVAPHLRAGSSDLPDRGVAQGVEVRQGLALSLERERDLGGEPFAKPSASSLLES